MDPRSEQLAKVLGSEVLLNRLGALGTGMIQRRVERGLRPEYNDKYLRKREKAGIIGADRVNLEFSGYSMQTMTHRALVDEKGIALYFEDTDADRIMHYHDIEGAGRSKVKRPFFHLTDEECDDLFKEYHEDVTEKLKTIKFFDEERTVRI